MPNIKDLNFNKNVSMVYVEEPGFTGYKGFDFTKIDSIEEILTGIGGTGPNYYLSGIKFDTSSINNKLFTTGDAWPAGVQGTVVFQADLSSQFDNVDISGSAGSNINAINSILSNSFSKYNTIELFYDGANNNTGVYYKTNNSATRILAMEYDGNNNLTKVTKIDY